MEDTTMKKEYLKPITEIMADDMELQLLASSVKTEGLDQNLTQDDTPGDSWNDAMGREFDFDSDF